MDKKFFEESGFAEVLKMEKAKRQAKEVPHTTEQVKLDYAEFRGRRVTVEQGWRIAAMLMCGELK